MLDVCLTCLKGEEWCFAVGEVRHVAPDQPPPWQEYGYGMASCPLPEEGERECPEPKRGEVRRKEKEPEDEEAEHPQPKALLAGEEYLLFPPPPAEGECQLVSPPPPPSYPLQPTACLLSLDTQSRFLLTRHSSSNSCGEKKEKQRRMRKTVRTDFCLGYFSRCVVCSPLAQSHGKL
ncbi:UNVERIFIED_CONTAM: hypothetical protein FKN15_069154 [Acipenser sinensis]